MSTERSFMASTRKRAIEEILDGLTDEQTKQLRPVLILAPLVELNAIRYRQFSYALGFVSKDPGFETA